jgi:outer membrane lipoprotein SlyB
MRLRALAGLLAVAAALAGCGIGPGSKQGGGAELRITRDFGHTELATAKLDEVRDSDTVMRFLQSKRKVTLRYGGGFVQSIDGLSGQGAGGRRDWFYWVNGKEASVGAADYKLHPGDVVQWDHRDWSATMSIPAIVGAFPEPFLHGIDGKRFPVRVECADAVPEKVCRGVRDRLGAAGVIASNATLGASTRGQLARLFVGTWKQLRELPSLQTLEQGPQASGVFAQPSSDGSSIELLDPTGRVAETAGAGTGLVAATRVGEEEGLSFIVTGVDMTGVEDASNALTPAKLRDAFAVTTRGGQIRKLPLLGAGR